MTVPVQSTVDNTHVSEPFGKLLEPGLRTVFFNNFRELSLQFPRIYNMLASQKAKETDYGLGGFTEWVKRTSELSEVSYENIDPGLERVYVHDAFTKGFKITKELMDDEQYRQMAKLPAAMGRAGRVKLEKDAMTPLVNGFDPDIGGVGVTAIYDGKALFANDHPLVSSVGVGVNLVTGALNEANLQAAMIMARETVDEVGNPIVMIPKKLIVPPALMHTAEILLGTKYKVGSDYNDINVLEGKLELVVMDYLGANAGGSDTAWFVQCDEHELNFFWRIKPEFKWEETFDNFVANYRGYMRYSYGVSDWRGLLGSTGL